MNADMVLSEILSHGGSTWRPDGAVPTTGYMVSIPDSERKIDVQDITVEDIDQFVSDFPISSWRTYYGAWISDGTVYLDLSINMHSRESAEEIGSVWGQLAIYDVENDKVISL